MKQLKPTVVFAVRAPRVCATYIALKFRGLLVMKLFWCVRNHKVVTLTLLKFPLVPVLRGNSQSSKTAQYSKDEKEPVSWAYCYCVAEKSLILWQKQGQYFYNWKWLLALSNIYDMLPKEWVIKIIENEWRSREYYVTCSWIKKVMVVLQERKITDWMKENGGYTRW